MHRQLLPLQQLSLVDAAGQVLHKVGVGKVVHEVVQDWYEGFKLVTVIMMMVELLEGSTYEMRLFNKLQKACQGRLVFYSTENHRILRFCKCNTSKEHIRCQFRIPWF